MNEGTFLPKKEHVFLLLEGSHVRSIVFEDGHYFGRLKNPQVLKVLDRWKHGSFPFQVLRLWTNTQKNWNTALKSLYQQAETVGIPFIGATLRGSSKCHFEQRKGLGVEEPPINHCFFFGCSMWWYVWVTWMSSQVDSYQEKNGRHANASQRLWARKCRRARRCKGWRCITHRVKAQSFGLHPGKLTKNRNMEVWFSWFSVRTVNWVIFRFPQKLPSWRGRWRVKVNSDQVHLEVGYHAGGVFPKIFQPKKTCSTPSEFRGKFVKIC